MKGFTLIELLVVVLIISILAAVALPQYHSAVEKARVARLLPLFKSIQNARAVYKMANGEDTADLDLLDITVNYTGRIDYPGSIEYEIDGGRFSCFPNIDAIFFASPRGYTIDYFGSTNPGYSGQCYSSSPGGIAESVCRSMGQKIGTSGANTNLYAFYY